MNATTQEQIAAVRQWLATPTESVFVVGDTWTDDHLLCFTASFCGVEVEWTWAGVDAYAAAKYANESPTARADLASIVEEDLEPRLVDYAADEAD